MATGTQPQIRVKSYFATSIPDAIELARRELGPEALLLNSREAPPEARHLGALEVVFGHDVYPENANNTHLEIDPPAPVAAAGIDDVRQNVEKIWKFLRSTRGNSSAPSGRSLVEQLLLDAGITAEIAAEIDEAVAAKLSRRTVMDFADSRASRTNPDVAIQEAIEEIRQRFPAKNGLGRVTALVGPPGSGKTTTLVKLAINEGMLKNRPVRLISADAQRIAASEQLRIYAAILGVAFYSADSLSALAQAIDSAPANTLLLIDTPGLSPAAFDGPAIELAKFFRQRQDIDTHLVLTASTRQTDLEAASTRFAAFRPSALIFTKLDETEAPGGLFSEAARSRTPLSYFCDGQSVPENIEPASTKRLAECLVRRLPDMVQTTA